MAYSNSKNKKILKLFKDNYDDLLEADKTTATSKNGICYDGIVNEEEYDKQKKKVIFLLKETNGTKRTVVNGKSTAFLPEELNDWNYRGWLQYQQSEGLPVSDEQNDEITGCDNNINEIKFYGSTFNKLCMWVDILRACLEDTVLPFKEYKHTRYNEENFRDVLKTIGIVNLKKTWGAGQTDGKSLENYLFQYKNSVPKDMICNEIKETNADIVICGSRETFDYARRIFGGVRCTFDNDTDKNYGYFLKDNIIFLEFYHPACRGKTQKYYDFAVKKFSLLKDILK